MSSLFKLPLLLLVAYINYIAWAPPHPTPPPGSRKFFETPHPIIQVLTYRDVLTRLTKVIQCALITVETTAIIAQEFPSLPDRISHLLVHGSTEHTPVFRPTAVFLVGCWFILVGGLLRYSAFRSLGRFFVMERSLQKDHKLVTTGPYTIVRHPSYTGFILLLAGDLLVYLGNGSYLAETGALHSTVGKVVAALVASWPLVVAFILMPAWAGREDDMLHEEFGKEWEAWARRTPRKLIPSVF